jgi:LemA protein
MTALLIIGGIVLLLLIVLWSIYNGLVRAKNIVSEAYSGIDVQLKKRFELIPNLIEAVKGYNQHEAETLMTIVESRTGQGADSSVKSTALQDQSITGALKNFRILVEDYPDLKANTQFLKLMDNLSQVENELAMARRYYNGATRDYNIKIEVFPAVLIAKSMGFNAVEFYEIEDDNERSVPDLNFKD